MNICVMSSIEYVVIGKLTFGIRPRARGCHKFKDFDFEVSSTYNYDLYSLDNDANMDIKRKQNLNKNE